MKYRFRITEYLRRTVDVDADSQAEAIDKIHKAYSSGEEVLDYSDFDGVEIEELEYGKEDA